MPNDLYSDLPLTNFPSSVDQFMTFLNIVASDGPLIAQYQQAMEAGNTTLANQILTQIPQGTQKIITATDLNKLTQAIQAVERFYKTDIQPYIQNQQQNWLSVINQFSYQGVWESGTSYVVNNLVSYTASGLNLVYIATSTPPVGTAPTNTQYWRLLTIQGQQGASGEGLSYRQEWNSSTQYATNDAVTYDGALWMALQASQNRLPDANPQYWRLVMNLETMTYPIQDTVPTNLQVDGLWFNTSNNPTKYYYLASLTNPAEASEIVYGQEAYDSLGNLIVGTLAVPVSLAVTTNPNTMSYLVGQTFDPTGMVITATYSNGSQIVVDNYTYTPTGALTAQDTTIDISFTDVGATVTTSLTITIITVSTTLNDNDWNTINSISTANQGANYWSVGDCKEITLDGTVGILTLSNYSTYAFIIGFNHNSSREGLGRIHFQFAKTALSGGTDICFTDGSYNSTGSSRAFRIKTSATNSGGWENSYMRNNICGTSKSTTSGSIMGAIPAELRNALKSVTKYTNNNGSSSASSAVTATTDYFFLLSEYEVFGNIAYSNSYEASSQQQYAYYSAGNSKVKYRYNSTGSAASWWLRSPGAGTSNGFVYVKTDGTVSISTAYRSLGFAPGFCV